MVEIVLIYRDGSEGLRFKAIKNINYNLLLMYSREWSVEALISIKAPNETESEELAIPCQNMNSPAL